MRKAAVNVLIPVVTVLMAIVMTVAVPVASAPVDGTPVTLYPGQLTVGVSLPSEGFETGVASGPTSSTRKVLTSTWPLPSPRAWVSGACSSSRARSATC